MVISLFSLSPSPLLLGAGPGRGRIRVKRHIICGRYKNKASAFQVGDVQLLALLLAFLWGHQKSSCWGPWPAALSDWLAHWFLEMGTLLSTNSQFASWKKKKKPSYHPRFFPSEGTHSYPCFSSSDVQIALKPAPSSLCGWAGAASASFLPLDFPGMIQVLLPFSLSSPIGSLESPSHLT